MGERYVPPRSPFGLIQEDLWPNEWMILVSCILLNLTNRKQVEQVLPEFMERWSTPEQFMEADYTDVAELIAPLGFLRRRTVCLKKMTERYLEGEWEDSRDLPGIGAYGGASHDIFCRGIIPSKCPKDGALTLYWNWWRNRYGR